MVAAKVQNEPALEIIMSFNPDTNITEFQDVGGKSALMYAVLAENVNIVKKLLKNCSSITIKVSRRVMGGLRGALGAAPRGHQTQQGNLQNADQPRRGHQPERLVRLQSGLLRLRKEFPVVSLGFQGVPGGAAEGSDW